MRRLLLEILRQTRWICAGNVVVMAVGVLWLAHSVRPRHAATTLNLCGLGIDVMNVLIVATSLDLLRMTRPLAYLPIRRRDVGASLWLAGVAGPVLLTLATKLLVTGLARVGWPEAPATLRWVMTSAIFDMAFVGSLHWFIAEGAERVPSLRIWPWLTRLGSAAGAVVFAAGAFALALYMPASRGDWTWPIGVALVVMLALTIAGYIQSERLAVHGGALELFFGQRSTTTPQTPAPAARRPFAGRLSGPRRMLFQQFRSATITAALTLGVLTAMVALPFSKTTGVWEQLRQVPSEVSGEDGAMIWLVFWSLYFTVGMRRWQPSRIRPMRTLPMSARELNGLLLLRPVVSWLGFWLVLLAFYTPALDSVPAWLGLGWVTAAVGTTALMDTAFRRWQQIAGLAQLAVFYSLLWGKPWTYFTSTVFSGGTGQLMGLAVGVAGIMTAFRWNARVIG